VNLASRLLGAGVVAANDASFGEKENLVVDAAADFVPGRFGHAGEIVDGWETRRRRGGPGTDWAVVRLGAAGVIREVDVDTSFFTGNHPTHAQVEAIALPGYPSPAELAAAAGWRVVVPRHPLTGDAHHLVPVDDPGRCTHVRLTIEPDGGVARLRVWGEVLPDPALLAGLTVDLAARELGGLVLASSDEFYTSAQALTLPGLTRTMGEGWETRRLRGEGHDWALLRLAAPGRLLAAELDTSYFVHNASDAVTLCGVRVGPGEQPPAADAPDWQPLLPRTRLQPDTRHVFRLAEGPEVTHVRLRAYPDGGLARLRLPGVLTESGLADLTRRWTTARPPMS
jgi:allantoicase